LQRRGYEVEEAQNGLEALRKVRGDDYDVAVVDHQLPPPNGLEILAHLRETQPRCVRVLMSGALDLSLVMSAVNRGEVSRVLAKPFLRGSVLTALEETIAARGRLEELCIGARSDGFEAERRHLEECLSGGLLTLALQPIVGAGDEAVFGYEALLRSRHGSLDSPLRIVAAAETHDRLSGLADIVVSRAAACLETMPAGMNLFINVHPEELADEEAVRRRFSGLMHSAHRIVLEITERSPMAQLSAWRGAIEFLTSAGFRIAVDDLGAGYNSLSILAELQPAFMKVDMSIVRNIDREERKQRLVDLLSRFARATNCRIIVEGIETADEADAVKRIGVDLLQGYLFGRPSPALAPGANP
jgi:EAL domain-containing protein (putative c-di-GMP-specific phosphodiesterase class I)/CheY-like chemotaxis protein